MKRTFVIILLLLLILGGVVGYFWPKPTDKLFAYVPQEASVVLSVNSDEWAKLLGGQKLKNGNRLDSLLSRLEKEKGISLDRKSQKNNGLDIWQPPLFLRMNGQNLDAVLISMKDSSAFVSNYFERNKNAITAREGFHYHYLDKFQSLLAWNGDVLVLLARGEEETLLYFVERLFDLKKEELLKTHHPAITGIQKEKSEIAGWLQPEQWNLDSSRVENMWFQGKFEKGEIILDLQAWLRDSVLLPVGQLVEIEEDGDHVYPATFYMSMIPLPFQRILKNPPSAVEAQRLWEQWNGRIALAVSGIQEIRKEIITYQYDENFNKAEVKREEIGRQLAGQVLLGMESEEEINNLLEEWKEKSLIQEDEDRLKLIDVFEQEVYVSLEVGPHAQWLRLYADTSLLDDQLLNAMDPAVKSISLKKIQWMKGEVDQEFWKLLEFVAEKPSQKLWARELQEKNITLSLQGKASQEEVNCQLMVKTGRGENALLSFLESYLDLTQDREELIPTL